MCWKFTNNVLNTLNFCLIKMLSSHRENIENVLKRAQYFSVHTDAYFSSEYLPKRRYLQVNMGFPIPLWKESDQDGTCPVHTLTIMGTLLCTSHKNGLLCTNIRKGYFCVQTISVWHPFNNISSFRQFHQHTFICVIQTCWTISLAYIQQFYISLYFLKIMLKSKKNYSSVFVSHFGQER